MNPTGPLTGRTILITGATSGIGFHTADALARLGAKVLISGRDAVRGRAAEQQLRARASHEDVHFFQADAATVGGNQQLARRILAELDQLDVLVNNVGGAYEKRLETEDAYEATLAINAIGPFALTVPLLPLLAASAPARIVNVASAGHAMWKGDPFADLDARTSYLTSQAYARAKLLNILWAFALARRLEGSGIVANATHPGLAWTSLTAAMTPRSVPGWFRVAWPIFRWYQRRTSAEKASRSSVFLASAPEAGRVSGMYFESNARPARPSKAALDRTYQEKAWELMASLVANAPSANRVSPSDLFRSQSRYTHGVLQ